MHTIAEVHALYEDAVAHQVAYGRWDTGVQLALLHRNRAWWLVLWLPDGPPPPADVERIRQAFGIPPATAALPTGGEWLVWVGGPPDQPDAQFLQIAKHGGVVLSWPENCP